MSEQNSFFRGAGPEFKVYSFTRKQRDLCGHICTSECNSFFDCDDIEYDITDECKYKVRWRKKIEQATKKMENDLREQRYAREQKKRDDAIKYAKVREQAKTS
jgi:hypothetical protein